ncbi:hypothetical protein AUR64_17890 [Haloprofundus marisrubri]|uniref:Uncharacterized protein n=1 Tax=Haloprofundus marisrubri TaxID=1514971 RepID=A0A0W1R5G7_9EURY|nr:hypothetical protein [Haloprofundus marisrubri]KTG08548.1 hypothetical protein AUR64_17890 [Haloprofundus marisrubri]
MDRSGLSDVVENERTNAAIGWFFVAVFVAAGVGELLTGELVQAGFVLATAGLAVVPAVAYRNPRAMLPWEVLALAVLPVLGQAFVGGQTIDGVTLSGRVVRYFAVAAVALVVAVELDVFTPVRMNYSFAVLFVAVTTMAAAGVWAVVQWLSDLYLGTEFLLGRPDEIAHTALMWDFVAATLAGVGAGLLFEFYFRRRAHARERLPAAVSGGESR